jgi:WD40 repeat protein
MELRSRTNTPQEPHMTERDVFIAALGLDDPGTRASYHDRACGGDGAIVVGLWDAESGRPLPSASFPLSGSRPQNSIFPPTFDVGAGRVAAPVQTDVGPGLSTVIVRVWDVAMAGNPVDLKGFKGAIQIQRLAFNPDGSRLALVSGGNRVEIWDPASGVGLLSVTTDGPVEHLRFSPDGRVIHLVVETAAGFEARRLDGTPRPQ